MRDWAKPFGEKIQTALDDYLKAVDEKILEKFDGQENIVEKAHEALLLIQKAESDPDQTSTQKQKTIDYILFSQTIPVRTIVSVARNNAVCVPRTTTTSAPTTTTMNPSEIKIYPSELLEAIVRRHSLCIGGKTQLWGIVLVCGLICGFIVLLFLIVHSHFSLKTRKTMTKKVRDLSHTLLISMGLQALVFLVLIILPMLTLIIKFHDNNYNEAWTISTITFALHNIVSSIFIVLSTKSYRYFALKKITFGRVDLESTSKKITPKLTLINGLSPPRTNNQRRPAFRTLFY
ncbi:unnamed protein product, partial [Mesorhabditis belari]|uniref:Uncharacterized protein n=1 Tax=Mesorhabditis belari TaxID=2138241 RepID=A0AAF3J2I7_9BILA